MTSDNQRPPADGERAFRLPRTALPRRYELHLSPDLEAATFTGSERIELELLEPVERIVCNAAELVIEDASVVPGWASAGEATAEALPLRVAYDTGVELVAFEAGRLLAAGRHTLSCRFAGTLNDRLRGFYRSTFVDEQGETRVIATTQFQETAARLAFPCFDEPEYKAVFSVVLDTPPGTVALSNGPEIRAEQLPDGGRRVRFGDTIPISTYIVAFVVGPLELTEPRTVDGVPVRLAAVPRRARLSGPALEAAAHALGYYRGYFDLPYPSGKLDLVAVPDFAAGAMENLGCVTFREAILLADPERTSRVELERLAEVVDHELAHMWFGDLVTTRWWDGIWLNEAFATFMALCCEDDYRPDWQVFSTFARGRAMALGIDALHATRPVEFPVVRPDDAAAMFDVLTYEKGASVLWMLEQYLGADRFRGGVRRYLAAHAYGNTETTDLWDALSAESPDVPVREVMATWLLQGGYPLVTAREAVDADGRRLVELSQEPFSYLPAEVAERIGTAPAEGSAIGSDWLVPVIAAPVGGKGEPVRVLLGKEPARVPAAEHGPLVCNAGGSGFYRTSYEGTLRREVVARFAELSTLERFGLLSDTWATTLAGRTGLDELIELFDQLGAEEDPHVWSVATGALALFDLVAGEDERPALRAYVRRLLGPKLERVGWSPRPDDTSDTPLLRSVLVSGLGLTGDDLAVVARAKELLAADHAGGDPVNPDLAAAVLGVVAAHAEAADVAHILERFRRPHDPMDGVRHLYSLGRLADPALVDEVLALCLTEVRSQNAPVLIGSLLANRAAGARAFAFVREHFSEMSERFPDNLIPRMLEGLSGLAQLDATGEPLHAAAVHRFCDEAIDGARRRLVDQSLERLEVNLRLASRVRGKLAAKLEAS